MIFFIFSIHINVVAMCALREHTKINFDIRVLLYYRVLHHKAIYSGYRPKEQLCHILASGRIHKQDSFLFYLFFSAQVLLSVMLDA